MRRALSEAGLNDAKPEIVGSAAMTGGAFPSWFEVPANVWHSFEVEALENGCATLLCMWPRGIK